MTKPALASVEKASWNKPYKPSGICPSSTVVSLFVIGVLTAIATGVVAFYGGSVTSFLAVPLISFGLHTIIFFSNWGFLKGCAGKIVGYLAAAIIILVVIFVLGLGYPVLLGYGVGYVIWMLAKTGKCRNSALVGTVSILCGVIAYGVFILMTIKLGGGLHETAHLTKIIKLSSTSLWMYLIVGVDGLLLIATSATLAPMMVDTVPFCETCQNWYQKPIGAKYSLKIADPLLGTLESNGMKALTKYHALSGSMPEIMSKPHLAIELQKCSCGQADYKVTARLHWLEIKVDKNGQKTNQYPSELWFTTMVPLELGKQLEENLLVTPK